MANIVILGAGVMGSALAVPASVHTGNTVTLVGSPLDDDIIDRIQTDRYHQTLNTSIPESISALRLRELSPKVLQAADVIVIGVSSAGIPWVTNYLQTLSAHPPAIALVTKGLVQNAEGNDPPLTYADALSAEMTTPAGRIVGIGGPCIARELALGYPTRVTFAAADESLAKELRTHFQTDYYRITTHSDIAAVEACAALKNFLCIGVSAMLSAYPLEDGHAKNPLAGLFNQAVRELLILSQWIAQASKHAINSRNQSCEQQVAFDLAGMGDLHVTVGGGRNSRLGKHLGEGKLLSEIITRHMVGETVEGMDTGRNLLSGLQGAYQAGVLHKHQLPLTEAILATINTDAPFQFEFTNLPA